MPRVGVIILAAGEASRMGAPKQLLDYQGRPLICHAADVALASLCRPVVVVVGAQADALRKELEGWPVEIAENPRWREGMGTSIRRGVEALGGHGVDGVILALADQPLITPAMLDRLSELHAKTGKPIVASEYSGTLGVPVLFDQTMFPDLLALAPDKGCKGVIMAHRDLTHCVPCPEAETDVDTPADYERLCKAGN
jgi:molybdenum cofactor cytidylyltransferase